MAARVTIYITRASVRLHLLYNDLTVTRVASQVGMRPMKNQERTMKNEESHRFCIRFFRLLILSSSFFILLSSFSQNAPSQDAVASLLFKELGQPSDEIRLADGTVIQVKPLATFPGEAPNSAGSLTCE